MRQIIRQQELNDLSIVGDYYLDNYTKLEPIMIQSIIDKYIELKFEHLMNGDIIREDHTGEVRMILRRYTKAKYYENQYDIIVASTGEKLAPELKERIFQEAQGDPTYYDRFSQD